MVIRLKKKRSRCMEGILLETRLGCGRQTAAQHLTPLSTRLSVFESTANSTLLLTPLSLE